MRRSVTLVGTFGLGFSSGLPLALSSGTLAAWLATEHVDRATIGAFALCELPYTYKFLLAPVFDRFSAPLGLARLGRRRGWLLGLQLALATSVVALGASRPEVDPWPTALLALVVAACSALQDVVIDALRIESFDDADQGLGAATSTYGYRVGMIASGPLALLAADRGVAWSGLYTALGAMVGLGMLATFALREPEADPTGHGHATTEVVPLSLAETVRRTVGSLRDRFGGTAALGWFVVFLAVFRLGDALAGKMQTPFLLEAGYSLTEIASISKLFGVLATMAGAAVGAALVRLRGPAALMPLAATIMLASNLVFSWLATRGHDLGSLTLAIAVENGTSGIGGTITIAYLSSLCDRRVTATQYAFLTGILSFGRTTFAALSGVLADALEPFAARHGLPGGTWGLYFALTALAGTPGLVLATALTRRALPAATTD